MAAKKTVRKVQRNPAATVAGKDVVRHWVLKPKGWRIGTAAIRTENGYVATVLEQSDIVVTAADKRTAERLAIERYRAAMSGQRDNPLSELTGEEETRSIWRSINPAETSHASSSTMYSGSAASCPRHRYWRAN